VRVAGCSGGVTKYMPSRTSGLEVPGHLVAPLSLFEIRYFVNINTIIATAPSQQECTREGEKRGGAGVGVLLFGMGALEASDKQHSCGVDRTHASRNHASERLSHGVLILRF